MSVYKKQGRSTYSYDFRLRGRRFSGDTGAETKREAERIEKARRQSAEAELKNEAAFLAGTMTFEVAASRWWIEVGQHHKNAETTLRNLGWLTQHIGPKTPLDAVTDSVIAALVARRRGERRKIRLKDGKHRLGDLVSSATVNRTCTQPLREIILRAKKVWKVAIADVDFSKHMLKEPQERVREASRGEEADIMAQLGRGYDVAVEFAFLTGCRRMEIIGLEWSRVDLFSRRFSVIGKGDKERVIPMSDAVHALLMKQVGHHERAVFTYVAARTLKAQGLIRGQRYPLTEAGLKTAMRRAVPKAGIENFRFHDTRHTAGTRALRASNLRVVQKLLGHSDIQTTTKYAHAMDDDLRAALNAIATTGATENATKTADTSSKMRKVKGEKD